MTSKNLIIVGTILLLTLKSYSFTPLNTHPEIQLGLSTISSYGSPMFANAMYMETRGWKVVGTNAAPETGQIDSLGNPKYLVSGTKLYVQPGQNSGASASSYGAKICITWEGEADIRCSGTYLSGSASTGMIVNGKRYYDNGTSPNGVYLVIYDINSASPPKNIKIWLNDLRNPEKTLCPDDQNGTSYFLHPTFIDRFGDDTFFMYRFMDWTATNESPIANWSDRRKPNHCFQKGAINGISVVGVCYEDIINQCNQLGKDMWINIPAQASEDFVKKLAALIDGQDPNNSGFAGLNKNLRCNIEYANEVGWGFWQTYCTAQGALQSPAQDARTWAAYQKARVASWFRSVVGESNDQYKIVECIQSSYYDGADAELKITCQTYGPTLSPTGTPDFIGTTSYISNKMEEYVFNELNYTDESIRAEELEKFFREYEKRSLQSLASLSGVDFTSGVSTVATSMSKKYNKPLCIYEGGSGMSLNVNKPVLDCKVVASGTTNSTSKNFYSYIETCGTGNQAKFVDFMRATHIHPYMMNMFEVGYSLTKKAGVQSISQYGTIGDAGLNTFIQYGYWYCLNDLKQDTTTAYRYKFYKNWYREQKDIRETGDSIGVTPHFVTKSVLSSAKVNKHYSNQIDFMPGDGSNKVELISMKEHLPQSLTFNIVDNSIKITGTPVKGEEGEYYFLYRILDQDNDPAYGVYSFKILPAPLDSVFAFDDFGTTPIAIYQQNTGYGFAGKWMISNSALSDIFIKTDSPLNYNGFLGSGSGYLDGGTNNRLCARDLDASKFDYLRSSTNTTLIRQPNTSLWFSALVRRTDNITNRDILRFLQGALYTDKFNSEIAITINSSNYFQLDCINTALTAFTSVPTTKYCSANDTHLLVMEINYNDDRDSVKLYIDPIVDQNSNGITPTPDASFGTELGQTYPLLKVAYVGKNALSVSVDDLRFGDSYKAVVPYNPNSLLHNQLNNKLNWFTIGNELHVHSELTDVEMNIYNLSGIKIINSVKISNSDKVIQLPQKGVYIINYRQGISLGSSKIII